MWFQILGAVLLLIILIGLAFGAYFYYKNSIGRVEPIMATDGEYYLVHSSFRDKKDAANIMAELHNRTIDFMRFLKKKYDNDGAMDKNDAIIRRLTRGYDVDNVIENSPNNLEGTTAYTKNKGEQLVLCLRSKDTKKLHDVNTLMFVKLHELSHIACESYGHPPIFWEIFAKILNEANQAKVINLIDYSRYPTNYCGMKIDHNPYFDFY